MNDRPRTAEEVGEWLATLVERSSASQKIVAAIADVDERSLRRWKTKPTDSQVDLLNLLDALGVRIIEPARYSDEQLRLFELEAEGMTDKEIAKALGWSEHELRQNRARALAVLERERVLRRAEAADNGKQLAIPREVGDAPAVANALRDLAKQLKRQGDLLEKQGATLAALIAPELQPGQMTARRRSAAN